MTARRRSQEDFTRWSGVLELSADLPMVIEVLDTKAHIDAVMSEGERMMSGGLMTLEKVKIRRSAGAGS